MVGARRVETCSVAPSAIMRVRFRQEHEVIGKKLSAGILHTTVGQKHAVREIWTDAMNTCELDAGLAAARISAAAAEGDIETAAVVLDQMNNTGIAIDALDLKPNVVTFACLVGAYTTAELEDILAVYNEMQELRILPNKIFAETYLVTVLQKPKQERWTEQKAVVEIRKRSPERIAAASQAIADFQDVYFQKQNLPMEYQESTAMDGAQAHHRG
ncbi:hypothetical protein AK812_SmicGene5259 [Symbiodinium microadriaticum]|uniref:Pentatricopeptide repeat-containing protein, chloroplastic n=1 Tax=Symbiodinium microadriaticum TaxID=2951 RepID=A0A1Q9EU64_SYMMI|nr:hypothetical protein AK812_SmicGene5259 [Symbiodinium microadriaticum]